MHWFILLRMCLLSGCETIVDHKGFQREHSHMNEVEVNKDTRESVREKVGSPTIELPYPDEAGHTIWYYVSRQVNEGTFSLPSVVEQKTYVLRFNPAGVLISLEESDKHKAVAMNKALTESSTYESGVFRDVFGSFGQNLSKKAS